MFEKKYTSIVPDVTIDNPAADRKGAQRVGQFHLSAKALYRPNGSYLPLSAVKETTHDRTSVHVSGCCAGGVWVERIIFTTDAGKFPFLFDTAKEAEKVLAAL